MAQLPDHLVGDGEGHRTACLEEGSGKVYPLLAALAAGATGLAHGPVPMADPASWVRDGDYPRAALLAGAEGVTIVALGVDAFGRVARCAVSSGSGSALLDEATCGLVTARGRFRPATDDFGDDVPGAYSGRVAWTLPAADDPEPPPFRPYNITVALDIDERGRVAGCRPITITGGAERLDPCVALRLLRFAPSRDARGRPVRRAVRFRTSMEDR